MTLPGRPKLDVTLGVRISEDEKMRAEILSRYAQARNTSDYLRPVIEAFLDREQKRLSVSDAQLAHDAETLRGEKRAAKKGRERAS